MILTVPISLTLSPHSRLYELRNASDLQKIYIYIYTSFLRHYASGTGSASDCKSPIEMKLAVKVSQYRFSPVKVVYFEYLV